ncbi:MAG: hypothetical protein IPP27_01515 [Bacteroidetes bacterium]|nr:hypothetical protein [Bacteroidota bacterium]
MKTQNLPFLRSKENRKRILEIKEFEIASKDLEQSIRDIQNVVKDTLTNLQTTGRNLKTEVDKITAISELSEIHTSGKDLIDLLADETRSLIEADEAISKVISSSDVLSKKDEAISKVLKNKEAILLVDIANTPLAIEKFAQKRHQKISEIETTLLSSQNIITPKQQIIVLESEIKNHQTIINTNGQQIKSLEREIEKLTKTIDTIVEIKQQSGEFAKILDVEVNKLVASSFEPIKETITTILSEYLKEENVTLQIRLDEKPSADDPESIVTTILAEIQRINIQTGELEIHSPSKYFNISFPLVLHNG